MICRRLKDKTVVWFGSYGKNADGTAKFYNEKDKEDNYATEQQGVADSLVQRLSIIRGELWYDLYHGLPLTDNITSKTIMDSSVLSIISEHPEVLSIREFNSSKNGRDYTATIKVNTIYGDVELSI